MKISEILFEFLDIQKTLINYGKKLNEILKSDNSAKNMTPEQLINHFIEIDPTGRKGTYVQWLLNLYLKKDFYFSDLSKIKNFLEIYHKYKKKIPEYSDINKVKSIKTLEEIYEKLKSEKTSREKKKEQKEEILKSTEVLYDGPEGMLLIPHDKYSACFWGRGSKWCTVKKNPEDSLFHEYYSENIPSKKLFIILTKDRKYQLSFFSKQFKNELNKPANPKILENYPNISRKLIEYILENFNLNELIEAHNFFPNLDKYFVEAILNNEKYQNDQKIIDFAVLKLIYGKFNILEKFAKKASDGIIAKYLRNHPLNAEYFDLNKLSLNTLEEIIEDNPELIKNLKNPPKRLLFLAIRRNPKILEKYYDQFEENDLEYLLYSNPYIFRYIKNPTTKMMKIVADKDPEILFLNDYVEEYDLEIFDYILKKDPKNFYKIPFQYRTEEVKKLSQKYGL